MNKKELFLRKYIQIYRPLLKKEKAEEKIQKINPFQDFNLAA